MTEKSKLQLLIEWIIGWERYYSTSTEKRWKKKAANHE